MMMTCEETFEERISREGRLARHVKADPSLQDDIINKVVDSAKGM